MKKAFLYVTLIIALIQCSPNVPVNEKINDAFYEDFRNENRRIRGTLYLDVFNKNLDSLTYGYYIKYLKEHTVESAKGLPNLIESADEYYFQTKKNSFLIGLIYKKEHKVLMDDANTAKLDTLIEVKGLFPSLKDLASKIWSK